MFKALGILPVGLRVDAVSVNAGGTNDTGWTISVVVADAFVASHAEMAAGRSLLLSDLVLGVPPFPFVQVRTLIDSMATMLFWADVVVGAVARYASVRVSSSSQTGQVVIGISGLLPEPGRAGARGVSPGITALQSLAIAAQAPPGPPAGGGDTGVVPPPPPPPQ